MHGKTLRFISLFAVVGAIPLLALAQGNSPFDSAGQAIQTLFTGTIARVAAIGGVIVTGIGFLFGRGHDHNIGGFIIGLGCVTSAVGIIGWLFSAFGGGGF